MLEEFGNWCEKEPIVHKDGEKEYCVFHAPADKKSNFNSLILRKIYSAKQSLTLCNLKGTIFPVDIRFADFVVEIDSLPEINFAYATFSGAALFGGVIFGEEANFSEATFSGATNFGGTTFNKAVSFGGTTFSEAAYFFGAIFRGEVDYRGADFSVEANFGQVAFRGKALFLGATFSEEVNFGGTTFNDEANFGGATFRGASIFQEAAFKGNTEFIYTTFETINTWEHSVITNRIIFENVDLSKSTFLYVDLKKADFINCTWDKRPVRTLSPWFKKYLRNALYDESKLFEFTGEHTGTGVGALIRYEWQGFKKDISCNSEEIKLVEDIYRKLKQKYKEEHNDPEVSNWHYGEKEMYRRSSYWRRINPISFSNLYWLSSGYGERPVRAGMILVFLIIGLSLLLDHAGLKHAATGQAVTKAIDFSSAALSVLQYSIFQKDPQYIPATNWGHWLRMLCQLLLPIQTALFAFALRNQFRR